MALIQNKKIHFDYEILERYEAGIELLGFEVKSLRTGTASLDSSYVTVRGNEAFIVGMHIAPYQQKNAPADYDERRIRRLLLTAREILKLAEVEHQQGLTIVPISVYNSKRKIKVEIAVVRGKKKFDKRETMKKRDTEREIRREHVDR